MINPRSTLKIDKVGPLTIGPYKVLGRPIGKGGMSTIYKVEDGKGNIFAIKELLPENYRKKETRRRFQQEFEILSNLDHENVVKMYEIFEANATLNILMEYIEGYSLSKILTVLGPLSCSDAASIGVMMADTLYFLHSNGLVHRDLKPDNILIAKDGNIKLTDFGIARVDSTSFTRDGSLLGTPKYMSPEQLAGKTGANIDFKTDIYSLGVILYEMVSRKDPYSLKRNEDIYKVINLKNQYDPKPLEADVPDEFKTVVMTCLERDPNRRYPSAKRLMEDLVHFCGSKKEAKKNIHFLFKATEEIIFERRSKNKSLPEVDKQRKSLIKILWAFLMISLLIIILLGFWGWYIKLWG